MVWSAVMKNVLILVAFIGIAAVAGCATAPTSGGSAKKPASVERASEGKPYDFRTEGTIPPRTPGDAPNEPDIEEMGVSESSIDVADADAPPEPAPVAPSVANDALVDGFRVQVFATADREIAENEARRAGEQLGLPAYVDLDGGVYKVRLGDFSARPDADQALSAVRRQYADAWVVASKVRVPRAP